MGPPSLSTSWKGAATAVALTLLAVSLAYQRAVTLELDMGKRFPTALAIEGFHDAEDGYRWSRARSRLIFTDPGFGPARLELQLSGFRPRGQEPPLLIVEIPGDEGKSFRLRPSRHIEEYRFDTQAKGIFSSEIEVVLRSDTFSPGAGDERALGVRVHRARLVLDGGRMPPLGQLALAGLAVLLVFSLTRAAAAALGAGIALSGGLAFFRLETTLFVPVVVAILTFIALLRWLSPSIVELGTDVLIAATRALLSSFRALRRWPVAIFGLAALLLVAASFWLTPTFELDLGSGRTTPLTRRFGALDRDAGVTFQRARAGATIDTRDFGAGSPWKVEVWASATPGGARGILLRTDDGAALSADVDATWKRHVTELPSPAWGWRGGHLLSFPGLGAGKVLRIDRIVVDRARSLPPLRVFVSVLASVLAMWLAFRTTGVSGELASAGAGILLAGIVFGLAREPVLVIPFLPTLLLGAAAAWILAATSKGALTAARERELLPELEPKAVALALAGFVIAFVALASPLYVGGHFGYHTAIAEEIWQGRFFLYYFPSPENMLSHQPQWGNLLVPHSCLYHTLAAPFAAFPRFWFLNLTKLFLGFLLFGISIASALVATSAGDKHSGPYAAGVAAFLPTGYQLLGLGHLMTLFGTWAATLALGFLIVSVRKLHDRRVMAAAAALLTLCFLSYTGSLLFASVALVAACAVFFRTQVALAKRLSLVLGLAWFFAFVLYYVHWTVPFVSESLPALVSGWSEKGGLGESVDLGARLLAEPRKLAYTFGASFVPLVGLAGLAFVRERNKRTLLLAWGGVLVAFTVLDLGFNFLAKHHYFTYPAVAVGSAMVADRLSEKKRFGKAIVALFVVSIGWMGLRMAFAVARGEI